MDVFSLLKFWRYAGVGEPINAGDFDISTDDDGSFFDLVFKDPNNLEDKVNVDSPTVSVISGIHSDHHYNQLNSNSKLDGGESKSNHTYSSSHAVFFNNNKSKVLPLDSSNTTKTTPRSPFRVLMLGFQTNSKTKSEKKELKCEIEEVTISSLLHRDNSLRNKMRTEKFLEHDQMPSKRFSKDVVHKYLNLIKPLYIKASKKSNEKVRFSDHSPMPSTSSPATTSVYSPRKEEKHGGRTVFKEVRKHLGKSRSSSSSSVKSIPSPAARRDDSAVQQQDGIQSAILHCKKSYNSPSQGCNVLSRSGSAPSHGPPRISIDEEKRTSI